MVSVCLPSDALLQHLPSSLGFSYLGRGVSLHGCSSKAQPLLLTLDEGYLLTTALPDLQCGIAPLGPPAPAQPRLLGCGVGPPGHHPWPRSCSLLLPAAALSSKFLLKFLILHSNTVALYSLPPILLTFSDLLLLFLFVLFAKFLVPYVLLIFPLNETLKLPFCLLPY